MAAGIGGCCGDAAWKTAEGPDDIRKYCRKQTAGLANGGMEKEMNGKKKADRMKRNHRKGGWEIRSMGKNRWKKRKRPSKWRKELDKQMAQIIRAKAQIIKTRTQIIKENTQIIKEKAKTKKACEKVRRKAAKARKKKAEKNLDRLLVGSCFCVSLAAALKEAKDSRKNGKSQKIPEGNSPDRSAH